MESNWIEHSGKRRSGAESRQWITEEEIQVEGQTFWHQGRYAEEPGDTILHTVISNDGVNWKVNDHDMGDVVFSSIAGLICMAVGAAVLWFEYKRQK